MRRAFVQRPPAAPRVRVLVCEDAPELRALVCRALVAHDGLEVVDRTGSARSALRLVRLLRPDVLVLDLHTGEEGAELLHELAAEDDAPAIVLFSVRGRDALPRYLRDMVDDHVAKTEDFGVLAERVFAAGAREDDLRLSRAPGG